MKISEKKAAAKAFAEKWKGKGYEKGESNKFWLELLQNVLGVSNVFDFITFEEQVHLDHTSFIDAWIPLTHVLIEQKGVDKDLRKRIKQSDGSELTPFQQAKRYSMELPYSERPRWIVTCNFQSFLIYDMENPSGEPQEVLLKNLGKEYYRLEFITELGNEHIEKEMEISLKAGDLVGEIYDEFAKQYHDITNEHSIQSLNKLCVRLVFCLYAEDAGLFGERGVFHDYLASFDYKHQRQALIDLFKVLNTPYAERDPYMDEKLAEFPYVNGGMFAEENIEIPQLTEELSKLILSKAADNFDWSDISPTIFGAVFESTLNPETRRSGGMHYTSIENIHKVIDPLFLNELEDEFNQIKDLKRERDFKLEQFQNKLASLKFMDPACGSGNFLTETYISLRRLENKVIKLLNRGYTTMGFEGTKYSPIKVSINQFYGIEINDFAVSVAKTALWIAESQMMEETKSIVYMNLDFFPLKSYINIVEANALRIDWSTVVSPDKLNYIMGNPPFVGQTLRSQEQSNDMAFVFGKGNPITKLDYVLGWYQKSIEYCNNYDIQIAFVSTNSICQGETVPTFWKEFLKNNIKINFAYQSFKWESQANDVAAVHCVIVGFGKEKSIKYLFNGTNKKNVNHINPYLLDTQDVWLESRSANKYGMPKMQKGSEPSDGGNLFFTKDDVKRIIGKYPNSINSFRIFMGASEFLKTKGEHYDRYCLWVEDPMEICDIPEIQERVKKIKEIRMASSADRIRKRAAYPYLFCQDRQPKEDYFIIPETSTSSRRYIPMGYNKKNIIAGNSTLVVSGLSLYHFGVLTSIVHMSWVRVVAGRMGMGYRYSPMVYNNFPWPKCSKEKMDKISHSALLILEARKLYPEASLSEMYDDLFMPVELRNAHNYNDKMVLEAYGLKKDISEIEIVERLMELYNKN